MSALHLVSKSTNSSDALQRCLETLAANDGVLFIEEGCYNVLPALARPFLEVCNKAKFYVLEPDLLARGLCAFKHAAITTVDDVGFVELTTRHQPILSWY